ncbi:hypothetical protein HanIR_Chr04g0171331 [Helianthus annuus]|nr:hypothetical protein HanIR_Chr04g0171331 [Helianthus annuus]
MRLDLGSFARNEFDCVSVLQGHTQDVKMDEWHPRVQYRRLWWRFRQCRCSRCRRMKR